jgi:predicted HTH domain antitoxin
MKARAVSLFKDDALPLGRAARLANMTLADFIVHLSRLGVPVIKGDEASLQEDLDDLDAWLAGAE